MTLCTTRPFGLVSVKNGKLVSTQCDFKVCRVHSPGKLHEPVVFALLLYSMLIYLCCQCNWRLFSESNFFQRILYFPLSEVHPCNQPCDYNQNCSLASFQRSWLLANNCLSRLRETFTATLTRWEAGFLGPHQAYWDYSMLTRPT